MSDNPYQNDGGNKDRSLTNPAGAATMQPAPAQGARCKAKLRF